MKIQSNKLPKSENVYLGIDQSLSCTSLCLLTSEGIELYRMKPLYMGVSRIAEIFEEFDKYLEETQYSLAGAAIEGYAYGAKGAVFNLGELGGVLRLALYKRGIPTIEVPPTYLKKFMTGRGNAQKNLMLKEAYKKYEIDIDDDNDSDAFALALVAQAYFDTEFHAIKAYRTEPHKQCKQIIGEHPKPLNIKEYFQGMPNVTVAEYEKMRKRRKQELEE